ncbi:hypothetical protein V1264_024376 [Littorina saxatilis]|uniref:Uncharacterized protein n=1 Tax=Littorina saxatilis TaxID=31220 RepID=A0AAN9FYA5_9CAEN
MEIRECFTQSGLSENAGDVQNAIQTNTSHACSNTETYKLAMSCIMDITRTCLKTAGLDTAILPDPQQMTDGLLYICDHIAGLIIVLAILLDEDM